MRPLNAPYIGVTGFMDRDEVLEVLKELPEQNPPRHIMVGALVSSKTLDGGTNKYPGRYQKVDYVSDIFSAHPYTINLIHYATDERDSLAAQLAQLRNIGGPNLDGLQLNIPWPDPNAIAHYIALGRNARRIVLQLGKQALAGITETNDLLTRLAPYEDLITDVLYDLSGGRGEPIDVQRAIDTLQVIRDRFPNLGLGAAGGLSPGNLQQILPRLLIHFPNLNIDAESRLRSLNDNLLLDVARDFVGEALRQIYHFASNDSK